MINSKLKWNCTIPRPHGMSQICEKLFSNYCASDISVNYGIQILRTHFVIAQYLNNSHWFGIRSKSNLSIEKPYCYPTVLLWRLNASETFTASRKVCPAQVHCHIEMMCNQVPKGPYLKVTLKIWPQHKESSHPSNHIGCTVFSTETTFLLQTISSWISYAQKENRVRPGSSLRCDFERELVVTQRMFEHKPRDNVIQFWMHRPNTFNVNSHSITGMIDHSCLRTAP